MSSVGLVLTGVLLSALSGSPLLLPEKLGRVRNALSVALLLGACSVGAAGALAVLFSGIGSSLTIPASLPWGGFRASVDALGAFFLAPIFVVPALGAVYGLGYGRPSRAGRGYEGRLAVFYGLLVAGMALVVVARDATLFLVSWELMALSSWFVATVESEKPEVRRAGWTYLIATHIGTLALFAMFALWRRATGSFDLAAVGGLPEETTGPLFVLAILGFGLKAGFVPFHVWLPGAHANAPSHVSAVMSGVMIKLGIYGILRMTSLMGIPPLWWGWSLLAIGGISGIAGIAWATGQKDIKRTLAYSSVENVGIIAMGIGLALLGRSLGRPSLLLLGLGGALFHVWNHSLFKSLLFLDAGFVIHETGTRRIDRLGGLAKRLPLAAILFGVGAAAISALPPLNGFAGEWLIYLAFFRGIGGEGAANLPAAAFGAAILAAIGALAVAAFVRLFGAVFLGQSRSPNARHDHAGLSRTRKGLMSVPMVLLAAACAAIGAAPGAFLPLVEGAAESWSGSVARGIGLRELADFSWTLPLAAVLVGLTGVILLVFRRALKRQDSARGPTWDCGYAEPTQRMQYGASSFGEFLGRNLTFVRVTRRKSAPLLGAFPSEGGFVTRNPDPVLDLVIRPVFAGIGKMMPRFRRIQRGHIQLYLGYVLLATAILLAIGAATP